MEIYVYQLKQNKKIPRGIFLVGEVRVELTRVHAWQIYSLLPAPTGLPTQFSNNALLEIILQGLIPPFLWPRVPR